MPYSPFYLKLLKLLSQLCKLQMHLVDLKLTTLNFTLFLLKEEVLFELKLVGLC